MIAGKDDDVLVVLAQSSGPERLYGRLRTLQSAGDDGVEGEKKDSAPTPG